MLTVGNHAEEETSTESAHSAEEQIETSHYSANMAAERLATIHEKQDTILELLKSLVEGRASRPIAVRLKPAQAVAIADPIPLDDPGVAVSADGLVRGRVKS